MSQRSIQGQWERTVQLDVQRSAINEEARTVEIALSSETPYERWYGIEILGHGPGEVNLERLNNKAAWLMDHNGRDQVGVIEKAWLDADRVLRCLVRFGRSARAQEIFQDIVDGIRTKVSVGYITGDYDMTKGTGGAPDTYRFTNWMPIEGSTVSIPADDSVGVGRNASAEEAPTNPPAAPAGTVTEVRMDAPNTPTAAPETATTINPAQERAEALNLQAIAERSGVGKEARELMASEKPLADIRGEILALVASKAQPLPGPAVDMSPKEARAYSYTLAIRNALARAEGENFKRGLEEEVSETIEKSLPANVDRRGGVFVPMQLRSGMDSATSTAGAELKYTEFGGELIELLRNYAAVIQMGARVMPGLRGPLSFPKLTADASVAWAAENPGSDAAVSNPTFGSVTLAPKTMIGAVPFSRQLLAQSVLSVESIVRESLAAGSALALDKAGIHGTGANNQPTGIYRTTSVNTKAMGGVPTHGKLQDMITAVAVSNALQKNLGWLTTPGMAGVLAQTLRASSAGSDMIWTGTYDAGQVNGYKAIATNQVSALMNVLVDVGGTSHGIIFGNWADLMIGMWGAMELTVDPYTLKKQGLIEVSSFQMADIQVRHPQSFCVATGAALS